MTITVLATVGFAQVLDGNTITARATENDGTYLITISFESSAAMKTLAEEILAKVGAEATEDPQDEAENLGNEEPENEDPETYDSSNDSSSTDDLDTVRANLQYCMRVPPRLCDPLNSDDNSSGSSEADYIENLTQRM